MIMLGVDHIGVGVSDVDRSVAFYGDLGFTEIAWDYTGELPGLEQVAGRSGVAARVVMLRNPRPSVLGLGGVKLVHITDEPVPPVPEGMAWASAAFAKSACTRATRPVCTAGSPRNATTRG